MRRFIGICSGFLFTFLVVSRARAATITVDTTSPSTSTSTPDGACSLGEAIVAANTNAVVDTCLGGSVGSDTIVVPAGTYTFAAPWLASDRYALPLVTEDVTIVGADPTTTILSIDPSAPSTLAFAHDTSGVFTWQHLTFDGGSDAAILAEAGGTLSDVVFRGNTGNDGHVVDIRLSSTTFDHVTFDGDKNGAITADGGTITLRSVIFRTNDTTRDLIHLHDGTLDVRDTVFDGNVGDGQPMITLSTSGGGSTSTTLLRTTFTNNVITGPDSAAVLSLGSNGTLVVDGCTFDGNRGDETGGLSLAPTAGSVSIVRSTFHANSGYRGGAIDIFGSAPAATFTIADTTFSGNSATGTTSDRGMGGAIYSDGSSPVTLNDVTVTENSAANLGGGIAYLAPGSGGAPQPFALSNTIVAGNSISGATKIGPDVRAGAGVTFTSNGHNLIGDGSDAVFTSASGDRIGTSSAPVDAKLAPYGDYGGPTKAEPPYVSSPAVGAGSPVVGTDVGDCDATDQEGATRSAGGCTVGAVQKTVPDPTPDAGVDAAPDAPVDAGEGGVDAADTSIADSPTTDGGTRPDTASDAIADVSNEAGPPISEKTNDGGCGCRVDGANGSADAAFAFGALAAALTFLRRRRRIA